MNRQLPVWRERGEWFGTFIRLASIVCFRRFPDGELQPFGKGEL
jgi:hypothetical protein